MGQIRILPEQLVNKIAAGEVIERPASVVKELLENAVDAGAKRIDVAVENAGKQLIQVSDDGTGMGKEDVSLAFAAHATSKLNSGEDLFAIRTMGFRGEALASIASVSRARIVSRTAQGQGGYEVSVDGGKQGEVKPTAAAVGTTVQVRDLFFNVPARRKFLHGTTTEMSHITEQLGRVALAQKQIHFTLSHNGRKSLELPAADDLRDRIAGLFGDELAQALIEANSDERGVKIQALLGEPSMSRTSGKWLYFFLNGRYIRDRFLNHAVREAYRGLMEQSRFPAAFVYLQMAPEAVDVNVHPTKIEVRFRDSNTVHSQVLGTLRERFLKSDLSGRMRIDELETNKPNAEQTQRLRQAMADFIKATPASQPALTFSGKDRAGQTVSAGMRKKTGPSVSGRAGEKLREELNRLFEQDRQRAVEEVGSSGQNARQEPKSEATARAPAALGPVLQIHNTYLVSETADGLVIVDQHALHERILYEKLQRQMREGKVASQQLLVPMPIDLSHQQQISLERAKEVLEQVGIELVDFGPGTVAVQAFPAMLGQADPAAVVQDIIDRLAEVPGDLSGEQLLEPILASMSCKAAVKAGDKLSDEEMAHLLTEGKLTELSSSCPHGRPTSLKLSLAELEKQFGR